jgi:hypothetical protein
MQPTNARRDESPDTDGPTESNDKSSDSLLPTCGRCGKHVAVQITHGPGVTHNLPCGCETPAVATDGGRGLISVKYECPDCDATHVRPERIDPDDGAYTKTGECYAPHPNRGADFEGCGEEVDLEAIAWRADREGTWNDFEKETVATDGGTEPLTCDVSDCDEPAHVRVYPTNGRTDHMANRCRDCYDSDRSRGHFGKWAAAIRNDRDDLRADGGVETAIASTNSNGRRLHLDADCKELVGVETTEVDLSKRPENHRDWCRVCGPEAEPNDPPRGLTTTCDQCGEILASALVTGGECIGCRENDDAVGPQPVTDGGTDEEFQCYGGCGTTWDDLRDAIQVAGRGYMDPRPHCDDCARDLLGDEAVDELTNDAVAVDGGETDV